MLEVRYVPRGWPLSHLDIRHVAFFPHPRSDFFASRCWQPCNLTATAVLCPKCFEVGSSCGSSDLSGTAHNFCGKTWCDAAYLCGTPCPGGTDGECNPGEYCFANTPCDGSNWPPILPQPPSSSPYQYCGSSMADASAVPEGGFRLLFRIEREFRPRRCQSLLLRIELVRCCVLVWGRVSPGTNAECPQNEFCYADVPCDGSNEPPSDVSLSVPSDIMSLSAPLDVVSSSMSKYCGTSPEHAAELCWQPCRDDDDCCADQTCHSDVTSCGYPNAIGTDHFFCGSDFCDASYECRAPCPSGFDAECDPGYRCFPNTPCNANMRSFGAGMDSSETLDYGLPTSAVALFRQYRSESANGQTDGQTNGQTTDASSECDDLWGCFEFWQNTVYALTNGQTTNPTSSNARSTGGVLGLIFGITILCLIVGNFLLARRQRRYDAGPTTATIQTPTTANRPPSQRHRR
ncbi:hypothetical protein ACHAW5_010507 [Stephanodiscus triporus]|uniref:Uncharacterized protein n=1 Tax=Stephanodiscus triporus TaxID=2934178 RepID=A0ABD3PCU9_9STRA